MPPPRIVACPQCGSPVEWTPASRWRPFCSERCRLLDLGAWASERYRIPVDDSPGAADESPPSAPDRPPPKREK